MHLDLQRHDLVWPSSAGWECVRHSAPHATAAAIVEEWAAAQRPLVVARQGELGSDLRVGLAAPRVHGRCKIALQLSRRSVERRGHFPLIDAVLPLLDTALRPEWCALGALLRALGVAARVHGSYGWQSLTGLAYLMPTSDIDLLLPASDIAVADGVTQLLAAFRWSGPRVDGELLLPDGGGVAWREWLQWRRGEVDRVLVKRRSGVALEGPQLLRGSVLVPA